MGHRRDCVCITTGVPQLAADLLQRPSRHCQANSELMQRNELLCLLNERGVHSGVCIFRVFAAHGSVAFICEVRRGTARCARQTLRKTACDL